MEDDTVVVISAAELVTGVGEGGGGVEDVVIAVVLVDNIVGVATDETVVESGSVEGVRVDVVREVVVLSVVEVDVDNDDDDEDIRLITVVPVVCPRVI